MAIVMGVLTALAVVSAIGAASKVQRRAAGLSSATRSQAVNAVRPALPAATPQPVQTAQPEPLQPAAPEPSTMQSAGSANSIEPSSTQLEPALIQSSSNPMADELAESILENMTQIPLAASLLVSEVVNPEGNELGVQLDRQNVSAAPEATPAHRGTNLLDEIAELQTGHGDRIAHLAQFVEHPDSVMRVSAAYALGDLATRTQGPEKDEIIQILLRLSQDIDPQVRVQASSSLGSVGHSSIPTIE